MMSLWVDDAAQGFRDSFGLLMSSLITCYSHEMQEPPPSGCLTGISNQYLQNPSQHPLCVILFYSVSQSRPIALARNVVHINSYDSMTLFTSIHTHFHYPILW